MALRYADIDIWDIEHALPGSDICCRYYFSALSGHDELQFSDADFLERLTGYVRREGSPLATVFCRSIVYVQHLEEFLRQRFYAKTKLPLPRRLTKEDKARALLIQHPDWSDERFRIEFKTTEKAMQRWSSFNYARRDYRLLNDRYKATIGNSG
jgi:hypothetical protein